MNAARRTATLLVVFTVLALAAAGCGVKAKDGGSGGTDGGNTETTTTAPSTDTTDTPDTTEDTTDTTEDTTDTTEDTTDTTISDFGDFGKDELVKLYTDMGLTEEQATCLVDTIFDEAAGGAIDPNDQSAIFDYLATCDIDITDFSGGG